MDNNNILDLYENLKVFISEWLESHYMESFKGESQNLFTSALLYIHDNYIKPNRDRVLLDENGDFNFFKIDALCDAYIRLNLENDFIPRISGFAYLTGIPAQTIYKWESSDRVYTLEESKARQINPDRAHESREAHSLYNNIYSQSIIHNKPIDTIVNPINPNHIESTFPYNSHNVSSFLDSGNTFQANQLVDFIATININTIPTKIKLASEESAVARMTTGKGNPMKSIPYLNRVHGWDIGSSGQSKTVNVQIDTKRIAESLLEADTMPKLDLSD